jgi:hypothetical protein
VPKPAAATAAAAYNMTTVNTRPAEHLPVQGGTTTTHNGTSRLSLPFHQRWLCQQRHTQQHASTTDCRTTAGHTTDVPSFHISRRETCCKDKGFFSDTPEETTCPSQAHSQKGTRGSCPTACWSCEHRTVRVVSHTNLLLTTPPTPSCNVCPELPPQPETSVPVTPSATKYSHCQRAARAYAHACM